MVNIWHKTDYFALVVSFEKIFHSLLWNYLNKLEMVNASHAEMSGLLSSARLTSQVSPIYFILLKVCQNFMFIWFSLENMTKSFEDLREGQKRIK